MDHQPAAPSSAPSPWRWVGLVLLIALLLTVIELCAHDVEQNMIAPIKVDQDVNACFISSSGRYVHIGPIYDLLTGHEVLSVSMAGYYDEYGITFLMAGDRLFKITKTEMRHDAQGAFEHILDGYVLDLSTGTKTIIAELPAHERLLLLDEATQSYRYAWKGPRRTDLSPNNAYRYYNKAIYPVDPAQSLTLDPPAMPPLTNWSAPALPCVNAWAPDSSGVYFIGEPHRWQKPVGGWWPGPSGPIRLLLTHPPFPIWAWVLRGGGILLAGLLVVVTWRWR